MNRYAEMMMRDKARSGRLTYDYNMDYAGRSRYDSRRGDMPRSRRDYGEYDMRHQPMYEPYDDYGYDMRRGGRGGRRDYGHEDTELFTREDIENWKRDMINDDGTRGEHFTKEQVEQAARQLGIKMDEVGGEKVFCLAMNMVYSDYCGVAQKFGVDRPDFYAELAKAFLKDKDFHGEPEEKLYLYYKFIVEEDE